MKAGFISSTGRTGTDWFTSFFNDVVKNSWSLHEPRPAFRLKSQWLLSRDPSLFEKYYFKIPRVLRHRRSGKEFYVETNYHLFAAIPLIRQAFPDAVVIHVIRDGRDVVSSWLNRFRYITNDHIVPMKIPGDPAAEKWTGWNPLQKLAWYWKTVNNRAEETEPDIFIKYEDIFKGERRGIFRVLEAFDGLEYDVSEVKEFLDVRVNLNAKKFFPRHDQWPDFWKEQFYEIAGEEMEKFGYSRNSDT